MRIPRVRFTVRGLMIAPALMGACLGCVIRDDSAEADRLKDEQAEAQNHDPKRQQSLEPSAPPERETSVPRRTEAPYIAITDVYPGREDPKPHSGPLKILRIKLADDGSGFLADLYDLSQRHFANDRWSKYGPDSSYREIVFFSRGRKVVLRSWHPLYEKNPGVVASSHGLTSLGGKSREAFLREDDQGYVAQRRAFDEIEAALRKHYGD